MPETVIASFDRAAGNTVIALAGKSLTNLSLDSFEKFIVSFPLNFGWVQDLQIYDLDFGNRNLLSSVIMANNFKDDKIQKVKNGTLRLQTIIVHEGMFVTSKVGAGILLKEGYVLTCAHVVSHKVDFEVPDEGMAVSHKVYFEVPELGMALAPHWLAGKVLANFYGGVQCNAEVLSVDVGNDLALLKIPESAIQPYNIPCEFSEGVRDGADFFVVGHPNGPPFNVKFGFVSNCSRPPSDIPRDILDGFPHSFDHMDKAMEFLELQVEAAPGFSGGPLSTVDGLVFGVLHAGIEKTIYGIPYAIIKSAVRRMFNRSRSPGYNVFYHLNKLIKTSEDHKATADKLKAEVAKLRKEASTANTASHALKQKLDEMKAEQQKLVDAADKKGFQEVASLQDEACGVGYILGLKAAGIPKTSNLYKAMPKYPRQTPTVVLEPETSTPAKDTEKIDSPTEAAADGEPKI